ncbi:MAG: GntR family transcriptional regulator [Aggregatilineales bacterium]
MNIEFNIDRTSYIPLYVQIAEHLREYLDSKDAHPGDQLPGESEFCRIFDVSRTVIRQALDELERDGLIIKKKGKGTFVAEPKLEETWFQKLTGFHQHYASRGYKLHSTVLQQDMISATLKIAQRLNVREDDEIVVIKRLRFVNDEPIAIATTYTPFKLFPKLLDADLSNQSMYGFLRSEYDIEIARGIRAFEAVLANKVEAEMLNVEEGAAMLLLDSVSYLVDGTPFEYYKALHRGDRSRFELEVSRETVTASHW